MNKELSTKVFTLSILTILIISLSFLGGLYYFLNGRLPWTPTDLLQNYLPVTREPISFNLEVGNPDDNILVSEKSVVVTGKTSPFAVVVIGSDSDYTGVEANQKGEFSKVIALKGGLNNLTITVFDKDGNQKSELRTIYYSEEKI